MLLLLVFAAALAGCKKESATAATPPIRPVLSIVAEPRTTDTFGPFAGSIEPRYSTDLGFRIYGRMVERYVDVGDLVKAGQGLAALDPATQAVAVRSAEASVANAQALLANATAEEGRQRILTERRLTPQAQYDIIEQNRETAAANLIRANAVLRKAQDDLSYTLLKADFDGVVTARYIDVGKVVTPGERVITVARPGVKEAVFDVPDSLIGTLSRDAVFDIAIQLTPSVTTKGRIREIAPLADPSTRTRRIRLSLENPPDAFLLGTYITVALRRPVSPRVDLPAAALLERDGKALVWIVDPAKKTVTQRAVEVLARTDGIVSVGGPAAGERVVIAGVHSLEPGQQVKIADRADR
jgi:RND family efflux transporter MFP subunit